MDDRIVKLMRLAVDAAASDGEASSAWTKVLSLIRKEKLTYAKLMEAITPPSRAAYWQSPQRRGPDYGWAGEMIMPFGKHKGKRLRTIVEEDIGYLRWCLRADAIRSYDLRQAVKEIFERVGR